MEVTLPCSYQIVIVTTGSSVLHCLFFQNQLRSNKLLRLSSKNCVQFTEVGIYKRKQEHKNSTKKAINKTRKKERKHELDQESDQENKKKRKKQELDKEIKTFFFS